MFIYEYVFLLFSIIELYIRVGNIPYFLNIYIIVKLMLLSLKIFIDVSYFPLTKKIFITMYQSRKNLKLLH